MSRFFPPDVSALPTQTTRPLWLRVANALFPTWSFIPACLLLMLGVVPEHALYHAVRNLELANILPLNIADVVLYLDSHLSGCLALPADTLRPDIAAWLKAAPRDLIMGIYLTSMSWGILSLVVMSLTVTVEAAERDARHLINWIGLRPVSR